MKTRHQLWIEAFMATARNRWWRRLVLSCLAAAGHGVATAHAPPALPQAESRAIDRVESIRARLLASGDAAEQAGGASGASGTGGTGGTSDAGDASGASGTSDAGDASGAAAPSGNSNTRVAQWANWANWQKWSKWNNWGKV